MRIIKVITRILGDILSIKIMNRFTEKLLTRLLIVLIAILFTAQIGLLNKSTDTFFSDIEKYEGIDINDINKMLTEGELTLELIGIEPSKEIKILINGYEKYEFNEKTIQVKAKNNNVIEIDGTKVKKPFTVKIIKASENIITSSLYKEALVQGNIIVLTRILLDSYTIQR